MKDYITNPLHRCIYCKGREVLLKDGDKVTTSLEKCEGGLRCIDRKECRRNILEESTMYDFYLDKGNGVKIKKDGEVVFELRKDE